MKKFLATLGLVCLSALSAFAQGSRTDGVVFKTGVGVPGVNVAVCQPVNIVAAVVSSNLASLTMPSNPVTAGFAPNMSLTVAGFTGADTYFNGTFTILSVTSTNIVYSLSHANGAATTAGTALQKGNTLTSCAGLANIYTDTTDTVLAANPFLSDSLGNYAFNGPPGLYYVQFYSPAVITRFSPVMVDCSPSGVGCGGSGGTGITCTTAQVLFGTSSNTAGCDANFSWNNSTKLVNIGPTGNPNTTINGAENPNGSNAIVDIFPNRLTGGYTTSFGAVNGNRVELFSGAEGSAATNSDTSTLYQGDCGSTNGSRCQGISIDVSTNSSSGINAFSAGKQASGILITAEAGIGGSLDSSQANILNGVPSCSGTGCSANGDVQQASASGTNSIAMAASFSATCSGVGCLAHSLELDNGDLFLGLGGGAGLLGQALISQGPGLPPNWGNPTSTPTWPTVTAGSNSNAGTFSMVGNTWDAHLATATLPFTVGAIGSIPATCIVGQAFFSTSATNGQNPYWCTSTNVWTQQLNSGTAGASVHLDNLSALAINTTLLPGAVNTVALGSATLPFTTFFLGTVANKTASPDTSALTANRSVKLVDAAMVIPQPLTAVAHQFATALSGTTGAFTLAQPTLADIAAGAASSGTFDFSGITLFKARLSAGLTTTVNGDFGYDTTNKNWHAWQNGADHLVGVFDGTQVNGDCVVSLIAASVVNLSDGGGCVTGSSTTLFTNKSENAEGTGNSLSIPIKAYFAAAGCNQSTAGNAFDIGTSNAPTPQCDGTTGRKGKLLMIRGNVVYINWHLPPDWNSSASTDIELGLTSTDVTNGHVISFNVQTGCNKNDGTVTDDPSFNALQALSITIGASQVTGGALKGILTGMTMTGCSPDYDFEIALTRNNSGTDTAVNPGATTAGSEAFLKFAELTLGVTKNAANR